MSREIERTKNVLELTSEIPNFAPINYLDIGSADGSITNEIAKTFKIENAYAADILIIKEKLPNLNYLTIIEDAEELKIPDHSIDLITLFVSFHHFKNPESIVAEILRVSKVGTVLIIREHDVTPLDQPYIDFVHLIEIAKESKRNYQKFIEAFHVGYFSKSDLEASLNNLGFKFLKGITYPEPNPQRLYTSAFVFSGSDKLWLTPRIQTSQYRIDNGRLLEYLDLISESDLLKYSKVLKKNGIFGYNLNKMMKIRKINLFMDTFLSMNKM